MQNPVMNLKVGSMKLTLEYLDIANVVGVRADKLFESPHLFNKAAVL